MDYRYDFNNKKKTNKKKIIFVILLILILVIFIGFIFRASKNTFVNSISNFVTYPIRKIYNISLKSVNFTKDYFSNVKKLNKEKEMLTNENNSLKLKVLESERVLKENESLKKMLEIKKEYQHFNIKMGNIIFREHDNWSQTFTIDIGSSDGIKENQAVVYTEGLVGYISQVSIDKSVVTTILDPKCSVSVNISTINEPAVLKGDLNLKSNNNLKLAFIPISAQISISDVLYTSGLGSMYPSAIPVGKIIQIINSKNDINRYAIVEPNVNIRTISQVGVII
ncbi:MAG: rod shape-determining protein MreC [Clostridia bacterium]